jgi:hypothetical protein
MHEATIHDPHQTNPNPNTSESKEQATHENPTKIARKKHENYTSYKKEIDATMKASIHSEVRFFTSWSKAKKRLLELDKSWSPKAMAATRHNRDKMLQNCRLLKVRQKGSTPSAKEHN